MGGLGFLLESLSVGVALSSKKTSVLMFIVSLLLCLVKV